MIQSYQNMSAGLFEVYLKSVSEDEKSHLYVCFKYGVNLLLYRLNLLCLFLFLFQHYDILPHISHVYFPLEY